MKIRIKIDGGSRPNPGRAACAAVFFNHKNPFPIFAKSKYLGDNITNNVAEHEALLLAMRTALGFNFKNVMIESDSKVVVNQFNSKWAANDPTLASLLAQEWTLAHKFTTIDVKWVGRAGVQEAHCIAGFELAPKEFFSHNVESLPKKGKERLYKWCFNNNGDWSPI